MKMLGRRSRKVFVGLLMVCLLSSLCIPMESNAAAKVKLSKTKVTLYAGEKTTLKVKNTKEKVKWSSSKKKVATVTQKGVVTAKKSGNS